MVLDSSSHVDAIEADDIATAQRLTGEEKLRQALELMAAGFRLELTAIRARNPGATDAEVERMFQAWLFAEVE